MPTWLWLVLLVVITFVTRAFPRFIFRDSKDSDTWYHLLAAKRIRENRMRIPRTLKGALIPHIYDYPYLLHWILALFPRKFRDSYVEPFIGSFVDVLLSIAIFEFAYYFSTKWYTNLDSNIVAILSTALFITIPAMTAEFTGPRSTSANTRPLGELFFTLSFMFAAIYIWDSNIWSLVFCLFFAGLIPITSKFGVQALLFISIIAGILLRSWLILILPFAGMLIALIISKGYYATICSGQVQHLIHYFKVAQKTFSGVSNRNRWQDVISLPRDLLKEPKKAFRTLNYYNSYFIALLRIPLLVFVFWITINQREILFKPSGNQFLTFWLLGSIIVFLLTSLRPFLFLGESERYLNFAVTPIVLLPIIYALNKNSNTIWIFLGIIQLYSILYMIFNYYLFVNKHRNGNLVDKDLIEFLRRQDKTNVLLTPLSLLGRRVPYETEHNALVHGGNVRRNMYDFLWLLNPVSHVNPHNIQYIVREFDIHIVLHDAKSSSASNVSYNFSFLSLIFRQGDVELYAVPDFKVK